MNAWPLVADVWLVTACWLIGKVLRWVIFQGGRGDIRRAVRKIAEWARLVYWEAPLRLITGRPKPDTVKARIRDLERDLRVGAYEVDPKYSRILPSPASVRYQAGAPANVDELFGPTARKGITPADIEAIKRHMELAADELFGPVDKRAVKAIQREAGLVVDGILGPITQSKINEGDRS